MIDILRRLAHASLASATLAGVLFVLSPPHGATGSILGDLAWLAIAIATALGALALGERARQAGDPQWPAIAALAALGVVVAIMGLTGIGVTDATFGPLRIASLAAPLALALAAHRAARARGDHVRPAAFALLLAYVALHAGIAVRLLSLLAPSPRVVATVSILAAAALPLVLAGALLATIPPREEGRAWRRRGIILAGAGAGLAAAGLATATDPATTAEAVRLASTAFGLGVAATEAGLAALAFGIALAGPAAPPPARPGAFVDAPEPS